jgi:hypothetical protein
VILLCRCVGKWTCWNQVSLGMNPHSTPMQDLEPFSFEFAVEHWMQH